MPTSSLKPKPSSRSAWLILFVFTLSGCAHVNIKDGEWCGDMGSAGASCFHTLSDESRDIDKSTWDEERFGMVCTKAENFANWKAAILKLCKASHGCTYEDRRMINEFAARVQSRLELARVREKP